MNEQKISIIEDHDGRILTVHSCFFTIQGEGPFSGQRAVFLRLAGCNLQCPGCDTEYSSDDKYSVSQIVNLIARQIPEDSGSLDGMLVVITGGEPFRQPIERLVSSLLFHDAIVQIETNGTLYRELPWGHRNLHVVCSPKTRRINPRLEPFIKAFKYVVKAGEIDHFDGLPTRCLDHYCKDRVYRPSLTKLIYVQPMDEGDDEKNRANLEAVKDIVLFYGYRLCLQTHKLIGVQ